MYCKLRQVLRCLLALVQRECGRGKRSGALLVDMMALRESPVMLTVSAAGAWCAKLSKSAAVNEAMERLSSQVPACECVHQEGLQRFTDSFGCSFFTYSFHVANATSQLVEAEQSSIQTFLHRLSLVHAQVKIIFEIRTDSATHKQIFSGETGSRASVLHHSITMDSAAFGQSPFSVRRLPPCPQMHPVMGDTLSCELPADTIEAGLCGEMKLVTMATLAPCMDQYSNWPTRLSCIRMLLYSPCWMPLMQQTQMSFLQSLATSQSWADLGLSEVCCVEAKNIQGSVCSEVEFSVKMDHSQEIGFSDAVEQTLTVFIFVQYNDPFHSQITDVINSEEIMERYLDAVFWYNEDQFRATLQSTVKKTLKGFQQRCTAKRTLDSAVPIVLSSMNSIIASSSTAEFRAACFDSMRVKSTCELLVSLQQSLQSIVDGRFTQRHFRSKEKVVKAVHSEESLLDSWEGACESPPEMSSKRIPCDLESSSLISNKRHCPEPFSETSDSFEALNIQRSPMTPIQLPQSQQTEITDIPSSPSLTEQKNEQVEEQWLQELEDFSEWD